MHFAHVKMYVYIGKNSQMIRMHRNPLLSSIVCIFKYKKMWGRGMLLFSYFTELKVCIRRLHEVGKTFIRDKKFSRMLQL